MLGIVSRFDRSNQENLALERLAAALYLFLSRSTVDLNDPKFLEAFPATYQVTLARVKLGNLTYCLTRFPSEGRKDLTALQRRIALFVTEGLSNKEIARLLKIKPSTVASHLGRIFRKLDINSRVALARYSALFS